MFDIGVYAYLRALFSVNNEEFGKGIFGQAPSIVTSTNAFNNQWAGLRELTFRFGMIRSNRHKREPPPKEERSSCYICSILKYKLITSLLNSGIIVGLTHYYTKAKRCERRFIFLFFKPNLVRMLWR